MDPIYFTRYAPYYALADWLLDNPDKARGQVLEISGKSWLQQFFVQSHTTFTNSAIMEIEVDAIHLNQKFRRSSFDWVIMDQVLEHVSNPFAAILQIQRVLRPGGRVLVTVPAQNPWHAGPRDYWRFSADSMKLLAAPFASIELCGCFHSRNATQLLVNSYPFQKEPDWKTKPHAVKNSTIYRIMTEPRSYNTEPASGDWMFSAWLVAKR
jgi:SAM-dependent methyltransferase